MHKRKGKIEETPEVKVTLPRYRYDGYLKQAIDTAEFYGFRLINPIAVTKQDRIQTSVCRYPAHHIAMIRTYMNHGMHTWSQPVMLVHTRKIPYKKARQLRLEIIGTTESSAEALMLQTIRAILNEYGFGDVRVEINSIGGQDSSTTFARELSAYYRSHIHSIEPHCREALKSDVFDVLKCTKKACASLKADAPQSISFLSETSRKHFREVLEYLETLELSYQINNLLVGNRHYTTRTVFTFNTRSGDKRGGIYNTPAWGERFDCLARKAGYRKNIPVVGATLDLGCTTTTERYRAAKKKQVMKPKVLLIQLGFAAKIHSLKIEEMLRKANMPIAASVGKNTLTDQLRQAQELSVPFIIIIGQKEVMDGTAIVRNLETHAQEIVHVDTLVKYLKKARIQK